MNLLAQASQQGYEPNGTPEIYTSENPYVRNTSSILPGVDLTAIPAVGRGILISPTTVVRAFHNGSSNTGAPYTFVEQDGTVHTRTQISRSDQIGDDLVLHKLDSPLPASIKPMRIPPNRLDDYLGDVLPWCYRVTYAVQHVLSLGSFTVGFGIIDQNEIPGNPHWIEAINGDSGGGLFMVLGDEPIALAAVTSGSSTGTPSSLSSNCNEICQFDPTIQLFELRRSPFNETPPEPQGEGDKTTIFLNRN